MAVKMERQVQTGHGAGVCYSVTLSMSDGCPVSVHQHSRAANSWEFCAAALTC